jgi:hypothetical protein
MPTTNASLTISRKAGEKLTGSSACATKRSPNRQRQTSQSSTNCSTRRSTPTGSSSPTCIAPSNCWFWFYDQRAGAENLIKEAIYPSGRWLMNCNHFPVDDVGLQPELLVDAVHEPAQVAALKHTTLATARLRFLFLAAKIWRHAGRVGVSYSDHYTEQGWIDCGPSRPKDSDSAQCWPLCSRSRPDVHKIYALGSQ